MQKLITSSFLLAVNLCAAQEVGSLSECLSGEDALIEDVKIENAINMFVLGDSVHADKLRHISKDTIVSFGQIHSSG